MIEEHHVAQLQRNPPWALGQGHVKFGAQAQTHQVEQGLRRQELANRRAQNLRCAEVGVQSIHVSSCDQLQLHVAHGKQLGTASAAHDMAQHSSTS